MSEPGNLLVSTAIVLGAATGVGLHVALQLVGKGWRVLAVDIKKAELLAAQDEAKKATAAAVKGVKKGSLEVCVTNLATKEGCARVLETYHALRGSPSGAWAAGPPLDALINCVAIFHFSPIACVRDGMMDHTFAVNALAPMRLASCLMPELLEGGGGTIVNFSSLGVNVRSLGGPIAKPWAGAYSSTKFALAGFSEALRQEAYEAGLPLRVIDFVHPGAVDTPRARRQVQVLGEWLEKNQQSPWLQGVQDAKRQWNKVLKTAAPPERVAASIVRAATHNNSWPRPRNLAEWLLLVGYLFRSCLSACIGDWRLFRSGYL
ncbi:hypothetical protein T492DRAFT_342901 [Pavlovales sp. CCMP2436]|nr:hypothetical protein T492DRAFT_342901 [Pavlovales sp. CCMP2436]